jgi:hypothetical protein
MKAKRSPPSKEAVAVRHPDARACSVGGEVFVADKDGVFWVPREAVAVLRGHGFVPVGKTAE